MKPFSESDKYWYPLLPSARVLDVGCYEGNWAHEIWLRYGCKVVAMEPIQEFYWQCVRKLQPIGCTVLPYALGGSTRNDTFQVHGCMSGKTAIGHRVNVEVFAVDELLVERLGWDGADLIKLNCEGSEYEILERLIDQGMMPNIRHLQVQFHHIDSESPARYEAIAKELEKTHTLKYQAPFIWEGWSLHGI